MTETLKELLASESSWEYLRNTKLPIVIYGMGNGADKVINEFERNGTKISAIIASDEFVRGQFFRNFKIRRLFDVEKEFSEMIIAITFGTNLSNVMDNFRLLSKKHKIIVPCKPVLGFEIFDKNFILRNHTSIIRAYDLLADNISKSVFKNIIIFYYKGLLENLFSAESNKFEVFDSILKIRSDESFLDLGAYRGDTIEEFLQHSHGKYKEIIALEPNKKTFEKLVNNFGHLERTELLNLGIWSSSAKLIFSKEEGRHSTISNKGVSVDTVSIDELLKDKCISYIKMDVEGAEIEALRGGRKTLRKQKPKLNIAGYHRFQDIFEIPLLIHEINPEYKIFLRHHPYIPAWDTNFYCV